MRHSRAFWSALDGAAQEDSARGEAPILNQGEVEAQLFRQQPGSGTDHHGTRNRAISSTSPARSRSPATVGPPRWWSRMAEPTGALVVAGQGVSSVVAGIEHP